MNRIVASVLTVMVSRAAPHFHFATLSVVRKNVIYAPLVGLRRYVVWVTVLGGSARLVFKNESANGVPAMRIESEWIRLIDPLFEVVDLGDHSALLVAHGDP